MDPYKRAYKNLAAYKASLKDGPPPFKWSQYYYRFKEDISSFFETQWLNITIPFRRFKHSLSQVIAWFPIIWRTRDWDNCFLFEIMMFKIQRMRKNLEKNQRHVGWERKVRHMKIVEELCRRLSTGSFYSLNESIYDKQYCTCKHDYDVKEEAKSWCALTGRPISFSWYPWKFCSYCKAKSKIEIRNRKKGIPDKEKEDQSYLFNLLNKNIQTWWD
jgi:hypothetical protein